MRDMINNFLDIERIERQASGSSEAVVIELLITSALSLLEVQFSQKQQRVTVEIPADIPRICGDPVRLLEVIRNLLFQNLVGVSITA